MHIAKEEKQFNFLRWYSVISFICIVIISAITIFFLSRFLTNSTLQLDASGTQHFVLSLVESEKGSLYFTTEEKKERENQFSKIFNIIMKNPEVMWVKAYDMEGTILWANDEKFIGHNFMPNAELIRALSGSMAVASGNSGQPLKGEHVFDKKVPYFAEIYFPVWSINGDTVVGAIEVYKVPHALFSVIRRGRRLIWIGTSFGGFFLYASLYWIVKRASALIRRQQVDLQDANTILEEKINDSGRTAEALGSLLITTGVASKERFFHDCVRDLAKIYGVRYAFMGVFSDDSHTSLRTIAVWGGEHFIDNFEYDLAGTPCENVLDLSMAFIPLHVAQQYPKDKLLHEMEVESYFGAPLISPFKNISGLVAIMDTKAMSPQIWAKPLLGIMANRMALELERQSSENALNLAESVFNEGIDAIMIMDREGHILRVNPAFTRMTGYAATDLIGKSPRFMSSKQHDDAFYEAFWASLFNDGVWQGEIWDLRSNGEVFPAWHNISAVRDKSGEITQFVSIFSDITEKKASEDQIYRLAHYDVLTNLSNRVSFQNQFSRALAHATREKSTLALLYLDIDHFKLINDAYGHPVGDEVLKHVARCLTDWVREDDLVARLGGDEFTILLSGFRTSQDPARIAEKILTQLSTPFMCQNIEIIASTSIGIALFPENGTDTATLLKSADTAMYRAKELGRNNFQFYTAKMTRRVEKRLNMQADLHKALERDEFLLHYQPQIDIASGKIIACEALIRWQHPSKGLISPVLFIPLAEENGLIEPIGRWVLETACSQWTQWHHASLTPMTIAVNLSSRQLTGDRLIQMVKKTVSKTEIAVESLELELTESVLMLNLKETIKTLDTLHDMGISLSVDDFGTGYSSLAYLKRFRINKLKIDQSFVRDLASDPNDAAIVRATIALAHSLNLTAIAEGVETRLQLQFLKENSCDQFQGYYFSQPLPPDEITRLLRISKQKAGELN